MHHRFWTLFIVTIIFLFFILFALADVFPEVGVFKDLGREDKQNLFNKLSASVLSTQNFFPAPPISQFCSKDVSFYDKKDIRFCSSSPKQNAFKLFELNLSDSRILFYKNGLLEKTLPIGYQSPYGKWFQTPTGYFEIGVKRTKLKSSIVDVFMEDAVQFYEDFFIHGIPYWPNGEKVTSQFSGGCIRLEDNYAKDFFDIAEKGDAIVSYLSLDDFSPKSGFSSPVPKNNFWIRQRFNSPLKTDWSYHQDKRENYIQHAGLDLSPQKDSIDNDVYAIYDGKVNSIIKNGEGDLGLGNVVIIEHNISGEKIYSLYGHLSFVEDLIIGSEIKSGQKVGIMGNTGFGCNYWKIGDDSCLDNGADSDTHLHLEIKSLPVLTSPDEDFCVIPNGKTTRCVGYSSSNPTDFGYKDPLLFIFDKTIN